MKDYDIWFKGMVVGNIKAANQKRADRITETRYAPGKETKVIAIPTNIEIKPVYNRHINGQTLGGDVENMQRVIAAKFQIARGEADQLLSDACERIELACDGEGLDKVTMGDIFQVATEIKGAA